MQKIVANLWFDGRVEEALERAFRGGINHRDHRGHRGNASAGGRLGEAPLQFWLLRAGI